MFDLLRDNVTAVPVEGDESVQSLCGTHSMAGKELAAAEAEVARLHRIIDGLEKAGDAAEFFEAKAALPGAQAAVQQQKAKVSRLASQLVSAREAAKRRLDDTRSELREPLVAEVFARFLDAVEATERLIEFDAETAAMGGSASVLPCPQLTRETYIFQLGLTK
jgi:hypothetical protein